jgi:hypothetical protein
MAMARLAAAAAPIHVYPVPRITGLVSPEGRLEEAQWQQATAVSGFTVYGAANGTPAPVQTSFRALYDEQYLYVGVMCQEPEAATLRPVALPRDSIALFDGEVVEVFVDPAHSHDLYYQVAVGAAGSVYDGRRADRAWDSGTRAAVVVGADSWTVEMAIPWASLGLSPRPGALLGFNVSRQRHVRGVSQLSMWSWVRGFHDPERYGHLVLAGTPEQIGALNAELRRDCARASVVVLGPEEFIRAANRHLAAASLAGLEKLLGEAEARRRQEQDSGAAAQMQQGLAAVRLRLPGLRQSAVGELPAPAWDTLDGELQQATAEVRQMLAPKAPEVPLRVSGHPRLYFSAEELAQLRAARGQGFRAVIWRNMMDSADWCLQRPLRRTWIAPVSPDPIYANLYDRFYAMMHDMAVMEHLAFAWAYGRDERHGQAAVDWALACCRVWRQEAEGQPNGSKAYAVTRLLKGLAVSYDLLYDRLSEAEREELRSAITDIGQSYHEGYFTTPSISGPGFHTHHAVVEWSSFGVAALAVLGEYPAAQEWLAATVTKFRAHLLPTDTAADGAQVEGATFWGSTMQYHLAFMDPLRRLTGEDLFAPFADKMNARLALASVAAIKTGGHDQDHETVVLEPSYGQINYYSPVLLGLARFYRDPLCQHLALWDRTAGAIQRTRYVTDTGEMLLFDWGGCAYAWYDPAVSAQVTPQAPLSFTFPSVNEAYLRASYEPGGIVVGLHRKAVVIHAGGRPVFADQYDGHHPPQAVRAVTLDDDGKRARLRCTGAPDSGFTRQTLLLRRPGVLTLTRTTDGEQTWWCYGQPQREGNLLRWPDGTTLSVKHGRIVSLDAEGYHDEKVVGLGLLRLRDPLPMTYMLIKAQPENGRLEIEVRQGTSSR